MSALELDDYKARVQSQWDSAADAWHDYITFIEDASSAVTERLLSCAAVQAGHHILDVASGYGEPALSAARIVGPKGHVVSLDLSEQMQTYARTRAHQADLTNVDFVHGDGEQLNFADESFDAIVSRFGVMFFTDPLEGFAGFRRVLRPEGRLAVATWPTPDRVPFASVPSGAISQALGLPAPPPGPGMFGLPDPGQLHALLVEAGFDDVEVGTDTITMELPTAEEFVAVVTRTAAPLAAALARASSSDAERAITAAADALRPFESNGACRVPNDYLWAVGTATA